MVGVLGATLAALGVAQSAQHALNEVWNIPYRRRPNFLSSRLRSLCLFALLAAGVAGTAGLSRLGSLLPGSRPAGLFGLLSSTLLSALLYGLVFRLLPAERQPWRTLVPGAVLAGAAATVLQLVGALYVARVVANASLTYGVFAVVIGLLSWLYLGAQLFLLAAEVNVVAARGLWPRSLLQPPLTAADQRTLAALARQERRRPEEHAGPTSSAASPPSCSAYRRWRGPGCR